MRPPSAFLNLQRRPTLQIVITPHLAAVSDGRDVVDCFLKNLDLYLKDPNTLQHQVNFDAGY